MCSLHLFLIPLCCTRPTDEIDVTMDEDVTPAMYDISKAKALMSDCERQVSLLCPDHADDGDEWEDHIAAARLVTLEFYSVSVLYIIVFVRYKTLRFTYCRTSWSVLQNRIFAKGMRVLQADRLARLSIQGVIFFKNLNALRLKSYRC